MTQTITINEPLAPATEKQIAFLTKLVAERQCPGVAEKFRFSTTVGFLAKGAASKLIDQALAAPKKGVSIPDIKFADVVQAPKLTEVPAFGYYEIDGTIYHWDVTGKDPVPTFRKLSVITNWDGKTKGKWAKVSLAYAVYKASPVVQGTYTPYAGKAAYGNVPVTKGVKVPQPLADAVLAGAKPLGKAYVAAQGLKFGFCVRCGATLTDPVSVANGIGPVCSQYWS